MTKIQFIELIKRNLGGGDSPAELRGRYHEKEIELYLTSVFNSLLNRSASLKDDIYDELGVDSWKYDALTKSYVLEINKDSTRDKYYSNLPVNILSITNNAGIRMITPTQEESSVFFPRRTQDSFLMNGLDVNQLSGMIFFTLEGQKIWYSGDIDCHWTTVLAKLVLDFNEFDDDDDIALPDGMDAELIQLTMNLMLQKQPMDIINDSTAIQTTK